MITQPTTATLADLVRAELRSLPGLEAGQHGAVLALADGLLGVVARRAADEAAWMAQEITAVCDLASSLAGDGLDGDGDLAAAAAACAADPGPEALSARYREASALLAACVPVAMEAGGEARARLDAVIDARIANERAIRGDLQLQRG